MQLAEAQRARLLAAEPPAAAQAPEASQENPAVLEAQTR
jgi:hypothetical protein